MRPAVGCCDVCSDGTWGLRIGLFFTVQLVWIALGLVIAGTVILAYTNPRTAAVAQYNAQAQSYMSTEFAALANVTLALLQPSTTGQTTTSQSVSPVPLQGNVDNIGAFNSRVLTAAGLQRATLGATTVTSSSNINNAGGASSSFTPLQFSAISSKAVLRPMVCATSDCADPYQSCSCSATVLAQNCASAFGGVFVASRSSCDLGDACGTCQFTAYLTSLCIPVAFDPVKLTVVASARYEYCTYPFTVDDSRYDTPQTTSTVSVRFMSENDPFIIAQRLTQGTMNFGWSERDQFILGIALLISGLVCFVGFVKSIRWILFAHEEDVIRDERMGGAAGSPSQRPGQEEEMAEYPVAAEGGAPRGGDAAATTSSSSHHAMVNPVAYPPPPSTTAPSSSHQGMVSRNGADPSRFHQSHGGGNDDDDSPSPQYPPVPVPMPLPSAAPQTTAGGGMYPPPPGTAGAPFAVYGGGFGVASAAGGPHPQGPSYPLGVGYPPPNTVSMRYDGGAAVASSPATTATTMYYGPATMAGPQFVPMHHAAPNVAFEVPGPPPTKA